MDHRVKQFLEAYPRVLSDAGWKKFFDEAPRDAQLEQIAATLAPALGAVFDRERGLIKPLPQQAAAAAPTAAGGADRDVGEDSGDDATALNIFQKSPSVQACLQSTIDSVHKLGETVMSTSGKTDPIDGAIHLSLQKIEKLCKDFMTTQGAAIATATVESSNETLQAIVQEAHTALEHMQRRAASLLAPSAGDALKRYADLVKWFTKTVKNGLPEGDATRKALLYMMGYKHRRYVKVTRRYKNPDTIDVDLHVALFERLVPLLSKWRNTGIPREFLDAATLSLPRPDAQDRPYQRRPYGGPREGGHDEGEHRPYFRREPREGGREGPREARPPRERRERPAEEGPEEQQFQRKEGTITRWMAREHWGFITYDGISTAYLNEHHVAPADRPALALRVKVLFDGVVTPKSRQEGKVEARNVQVIGAAAAAAALAAARS